MEKLKKEELEQAGGGLIVQGESYEGYFIVNPRTGDVLDRQYYFSDATKSAERLGVSSTIMSKAKYKQKYGRDIS